MVKDETVGFPAEPGGCFKGGKGLGYPFFPLPEPDRIQMGVADEMNGL